nr:MAG TPA: NinG recombination protein [Caudoviricetes sp.]
MKAAGALKEAARCLGVDKDIADAYSKKIKSVSFDDDEDFYDDELEHAKLDHVNDGKHNELFKLAKQLVGIMTGFGKHASAVIVSNQDITKYCSLEMQKDSKTKEETYVASTNFKHLESMGFLKEDILGLRTLDVIDDCVSIAGVKDSLDLINLPWNDEKTLDLLRKGDTLGVFQMKSYGMTQVLKDIAPRSFVDLISVVALYRPACILGGTLQEFIDRRNGKPFEYLDPRLKDVLSETYGIMLYQEDIMKVVQVIGGYSMAEADTVRRAIGKKDHDLMQQITGEFIERAKSTGTDPEVAQKILDMIVAAGSYSFNHCISGDTVLYRDKGRHKPLTVAEMYKTMHDREWAKKNGHKHLNDKYRRYGYGKSLSMVDDRIKINDIVDIYYKGKNDVYLVETENGSFVKATMKHKFPTPDGIKQLQQLQVGDLLYTKGDRAVVKETYNLTDLERSTNLPTKGQRGFQRQDYSATRNFEDAITTAKQEQKPCELCGCGYGSTRFEMHHKDFNRKNNDLDNFQWLCVSCHKKEHYKHGRAKKGDHGYFINIDKIKSITYVGVEDVYDVEMAHPNHTFVVNNGLVVCNSHSQSYGYMAYITAYLKAHYPLEFYVATINSEDGNQEKILPYIQEIKRKGIEILPPDLRHSKREWTVQGNSIRVGLSYIRGINKIEKPQEYTIDAIFSKYTKLQLEGLVGSGALDFLGDTNELMALIPEYKSYDGDRKNALAKIDEWKAKLMEHEKLMSQEFEHATPKEQQSMKKKKVSIENKIQEWTDKYNSIVLIESPNLTYTVPVSSLRYKYLGCSFEDPLKGYNTNLANGRDVKAIICSKFERRTTKAGKPMANILDHNGNRYVMWSNYLVELECGKGYYIQVYGDTIRKVKPLELKQNTP